VERLIRPTEKYECDASDTFLNATENRRMDIGNIEQKQTLTAQ